MTTYIVSRHRDDLDSPSAIRGTTLMSLVDCLTDLADPLWESLPQHIQPGETVRASLSGLRPGTHKRMHLGAWIRAEEDWTTALNDARDRLSAITGEREEQMARRDEAIRAALADGRDAGLIAYQAGVSRERVYQIRDHRR